MTLLLALCLWLLTAWAGEGLVWWVATPEEAAQVEAALQQVWPAAPVRVQVGARPEGADGILLTGEEGLSFVSGDIERSRPGEVDVRTAAALVRSWARPAPLPAEPPPPEVVPDPAPVVVPEERGGWEVSGVAGPATRWPDRGPAFHFAVQVASPRLILSAELDPAERVRLAEAGEGGLIVRRLGATAGLRGELPLEDGWSLEGSATAGARLHSSSTLDRSQGAALLLLPTAALRARVWNPAPERGARLGGGVMISFDGLSWWQWYDAGPGARLRPLTVAVEFGARWGLAPRES